MLPASRERILRTVPDDARVLDVGGWAKTFSRADWVIDYLPWETRGLYALDDAPERFSRDTWVVHDICARDPFPFEDDSFDFVVCSQTLEDIRDPVWVCSEIARVGRAGYIETPSRLEEQSFWVHGPWAGWTHHRWLIETRPGAIEFALKPHMINVRPSDHFPEGFHATLTAEERIAQLWWEDTFEFRERYNLTPEETDEYVAGFVRDELAARGLTRTRRGKLKRA